MATRPVYRSGPPRPRISLRDHYLEQTGLKEYRETEGFGDVFVLRREIGDETEFVLVTLWDSREAIRGFAGPEPERAVYYPED